jgi:energy-coupling factor transporter ATP-binding protein EcfA2
MASEGKFSSVLETILEWSTSSPKPKPDWQRDALRRIVSTGTPTQEDVAELVALCKQGQDEKPVTLKASVLEAAHLPADPAAGESVDLVSISDVKGVNQLAPNNTVCFKPSKLNIVYGQNGTGKSGYARILKRACRARHAGEIMPDAFNPNAPAKATANITASTATGGEQVIAWKDDDQPQTTLSAITVFDRDSGAVHLRQKNEVWFRPFGLDIPDDLAAVCQQVKEALTAEKTQLEQAQDRLFSDPIWSDTSRIGKFLNNLNEQSDLAAIESEPALTEEDQVRLIQLQRDLNLDPEKVAGEQRQRAIKISQMIETLKGIQLRFSDDAIDTLVSQRSVAASAREAADVAAVNAFGELELDGIGAHIWRELWESARRYSHTLESKEQMFPPQEGDICVLCQQPIDNKTFERMRGFEGFIKADTGERARQAEQVFQSTLAKFSKERIDIRLIGEARRIIQERDPELSRVVLKFVASARLRRKEAVRAASTESMIPSIPLRPLQLVELKAAFDAIQNYADELAGSSDPTRRQLLVEELNDLKDRQQMDRLKKLAEVEITRHQGIHRLHACIGETTTNSITNLGNNIADNLITPKMQARFAKEITKLAGSRIKVEVVRSGGRFGSPQYEVRFFANAKAKVGMVLSEGEQTCVALASYLTELANASHRSALVFDDPVSSLDHRWRRKVAERLVEESQERQVVVFTHDLIFVNDLHEMAINAGTMGTLGSLSRSNQGAGIYSEGLPWRASKVRDRVDKLEKSARKAKSLFDNEDDEAYRREVGQIYGDLRSAWERGLEDVVFAGVLMRHRDYINPKNLKKLLVIADADVEAFQEGFQRCSDFTDAHDSSRGRDDEPPSPDDVMVDIQALATWEKALRAKQNAQA